MLNAWSLSKFERFFFVLLGTVFRLRLFFIEVDILLLYIINNDLKVNNKKFDHILVHIGHTSIKRPPLLNGHLAIPQGWPLNRGSTVILCREVKVW